MKEHVFINVNGSDMSLDLPRETDPLAFIAQEVEVDLGKNSGEDTALDPGVKVEYTYREWTVTVERKNNVLHFKLPYRG